MDIHLIWQESQSLAITILTSPHDRIHVTWWEAFQLSAPVHPGRHCPYRNGNPPSTSSNGHPQATALHWLIQPVNLSSLNPCKTKAPPALLVSSRCILDSSFNRRHPANSYCYHLTRSSASASCWLQLEIEGRDCFKWCKFASQYVVRTSHLDWVAQNSIFTNLS
jgi:hypothetical protein